MNNHGPATNSIPLAIIKTVAIAINCILLIVQLLERPSPLLVMALVLSGAIWMLEVNDFVKIKWIFWLSIIFGVIMIGLCLLLGLTTRVERSAEGELVNSAQQITAQDSTSSSFQENEPGKAAVEHDEHIRLYTRLVFHEKYDPPIGGFGFSYSIFSLIIIGLFFFIAGGNIVVVWKDTKNGSSTDVGGTSPKESESKSADDILSSP